MVGASSEKAHLLWTGSSLWWSPGVFPGSQMGEKSQTTACHQLGVFLTQVHSPVSIAGVADENKGAKGHP